MQDSDKNDNKLDWELKVFDIIIKNFSHCGYTKLKNYDDIRALLEKNKPHI